VAQMVASDMLAVVLILGVVTTVLSSEIHLMLLGIGVVEVGGGHFEDLRDGNEEMEQIDDFDPGILLVELLVLGPPFPWDAVGQFSDFLGQRPAIVQYPLLPLLVGHLGRVDANPFVKLLLEAKDLFKFVGCIHKRWSHYRENVVKNHCFSDIDIGVAG
jgi:hypothetical protein